MKKKLFLLLLGIGFAVIISTSAYAMSNDSPTHSNQHKFEQKLVTDTDFQNILGMTADEIKYELNSGKTIAQLLDEKKVSHEQLAILREKKHTSMKNQWFAKNTEIQKLLNMTQEEITKTLTNGKTIPQLLDEKKVTHEQMNKIRKESIDNKMHKKMKRQKGSN